MPFENNDYPTNTVSLEIENLEVIVKSPESKGKYPIFGMDDAGDIREFSKKPLLSP